MSSFTPLSLCLLIPHPLSCLPINQGLTHPPSSPPLCRVYEIGTARIAAKETYHRHPVAVNNIARHRYLRLLWTEVGLGNDGATVRLTSDSDVVEVEGNFDFRNSLKNANVIKIGGAVSECTKAFSPSLFAAISIRATKIARFGLLLSLCNSHVWSADLQSGQVQGPRSNSKRNPDCAPVPRPEPAWTKGVGYQLRTGAANHARQQLCARAGSQ